MKTFGRFILPAQPGGCAMEDREDGQVYVLSTEGEYVALRPVPRRYGGPAFPAFDGPIMKIEGAGWVRLLIRDGRLGYEPLRFVTPVLVRRWLGVFTRRPRRPFSVWEILSPEAVEKELAYIRRAR